MKLKYTLSKEQFHELCGLSYHVADLNYIKEKYGNDDPEIKNVRKTISLHFDICDRLNIPFWVQNTVIAFSENWRNILKTDLFIYLESKNITLE